MYHIFFKMLLLPISWNTFISLVKIALKFVSTELVTWIYIWHEFVMVILTYENSLNFETVFFLLVILVNDLSRSTSHCISLQIVTELILCCFVRTGLFWMYHYKRNSTCIICCDLKFYFYKYFCGFEYFSKGSTCKPLSSWTNTFGVI